jgi:hypothetical protein
MRATEFMHYINISSKDLKLGHNLKGDDYTHMTIRMRVKRARYKHQTELRKQEREAKKAADKIRKYFRRKK